jgi:hypothetical protein
MATADPGAVSGTRNQVRPEIARWCLTSGSAPFLPSQDTRNIHQLASPKLSMTPSLNPATGPGPPCPAGLPCWPAQRTSEAHAHHPCRVLPSAGLASLPPRSCWTRSQNFPGSQVHLCLPLGLSNKNKSLAGIQAQALSGTGALGHSFCQECPDAETRSPQQPDANGMQLSSKKSCAGLFFFFCQRVEDKRATSSHHEVGRIMAKSLPSRLFPPCADRTSAP